MNKINNYQKYTLLKEYVNYEFDMEKFVTTISAEKNPDIIADLLQILYNRTEYQQNIETHFKDDINMLQFPVEVAKERDLNTIKLIDGLLNKQLDKLNSGEVSPDKEIKLSDDDLKNRTIGYAGKNIITEFPKQDISTAYKRPSKIGFRKESIKNFSTFLN
jgi:hypothetical protein